MVLLAYRVALQLAQVVQVAHLSALLLVWCYRLCWLHSERVSGREEKLVGAVVCAAVRAGW